VQNGPRPAWPGERRAEKPNTNLERRSGDAGIAPAQDTLGTDGSTMSATCAGSRICSLVGMIPSRGTVLETTFKR
jgi:hypothetical protein